MNIDKSEIENFDNYAHEWWNKRGPYKFIHLLTPLRLKYISKQLKTKRIEGIRLRLRGWTTL